MKIIGFFLLISMTVSITIELNNIHNGYRNVYKGTVQIEEPKIRLKPFELVKNELEEKDARSISILDDEVSIDMDKYVRQYYLQDIDPSSPISLIFRFYDRPSLVLTIFSQKKEQDENDLLMQISGLGKDISDLDL